MSAMPEAMRIMDSGLNFAFNDCGSWRPPALRLPAKEDLLAALFGRMERGVLEVLAAESPEDFGARLGRSLPAFWRQMMASAELLPQRSESEEQEQWEEVVQQAAVFGGDAWSDAMQDSFRSIRWAARIGRRLRPSEQMPPEVLVRMLKHHVAVMLWSWAAFAVQVTIRHSSSVSAEVREALLSLLHLSSSEAFTSVRSIELERQEAELAQATSAEAGPVEMDPEIRLLEEDAHQESTRLLAAISA